MLRSMSRWELLQAVASGRPTDASLFRSQSDERLALKGSTEAINSRLKRMGSPAPEELKSLDSLTMNEVSIKKAHVQHTGKKQDDEVGLPQVSAAWGPGTLGAGRRFQLAAISCCRL